MVKVAAACVALAVSFLGAGQVVINEVGWGGTAASPYDEWIELYNPTDQPIDLSGWTLAWEGVAIPLGEEAGNTIRVVNSVIPAYGFLLLERGGDDTVVGREADVLYRGALANRGEVLQLIDPEGNVVSTANLGCVEGWWAGAKGASMERVAPEAPDGRFFWRTGQAGELLDAQGAPIRGTPGAPNLAYLVSPRVELVLPEGPLTGLVTWQWQAADPDTPESELVVGLYVSYDGGATLQPVAEGLPASGSYDWDTAGWEPGPVLLVVRAQDPDGFWGAAVQEVELAG